MIDRAERLLKKWRRAFSRSRWLGRILGFPTYPGSPIRPGLVMIQIDGLSQPEFRKALYRGELPFLKYLIDRENYQEHSHYSGLPSCTPAVQAEIFYGVKTSVPAFSFRDEEACRIVRMYEPSVAAAVEKRLLEQCPEPLLKGGSAYCDNFSGGAEEAHFCASTLGMKAAFEALNPLKVFLLVVTNLGSVFRVLALILVEFVFATMSFFRGVLTGMEFFKELKFIPTRVGICVLLRELLVIGGKIDIERGMPIVHLNFIGFDEQAHRRGPVSDFAHWCLKGIDDAIKRVWIAAQHAPWRQYDVWIYSDHGQCDAKPYYKFKGYAIEDALNDAFGKLNQGIPLILRTSLEAQRCCLLGSHKHGHHKHPVLEQEQEQSEDLTPQVAALGPVGFVYGGKEYSREELAIVADALAIEHQVPVVITREKDEQLLARTAAGNFALPAQMDALFGKEHPFLEDMKEDLLRLCRHPCSGDMIILGWREGVESVTFVAENGSHAGLTHEETNAFSLLPRDTQLPDNGKNYLRPAELRAAALHFLGREIYECPPRLEPFTNVSKDTLKVMTYNVHSCVGLDGKLDLARISRVIALEEPDVVCLQELDLRRARSGKDDQAQLIAELLEMNYHFHPAMHMEEEQYGDAILTHLPMRTVKTGVLPGVKPGSRREPRGALWVAVNFNGRDVNIINTHLGLTASEQLQQVHALLGEEWLGPILKKDEEDVILCGDFNAGPSSRPYKLLASSLDDVQHMLERKQRAQKTFYSRFPSFRIDHIFVSGRFEALGVKVPKHRTAVNASDHLPLVVELKLKNGDGNS